MMPSLRKVTGEVSLWGERAWETAILRCYLELEKKSFWSFVLVFWTATFCIWQVLLGLTQHSASCLICPCYLIHVGEERFLKLNQHANVWSTHQLFIPSVMTFILSSVLESGENSTLLLFFFRMKPWTQFQHMQVKIIRWDSFHQIDRFHNYGSAWESLLLKSMRWCRKDNQCLAISFAWPSKQRETTCLLLVFALLIPCMP